MHRQTFRRLPTFLPTARFTLMPSSSIFSFVSDAIRFDRRPTKCKQYIFIRIIIVVLYYFDQSDSVSFVIFYVCDQLLSDLVHDKVSLSLFHHHLHPLRFSFLHFDRCVPDRVRVLNKSVDFINILLK